MDNATLCDQICVNTDGSYFCSCIGGYVLEKGTNMCVGKLSALLYFLHNIIIMAMCHADINECDSINDCQQVCMNTDGSFACTCTECFILASDGKNCTGKIFVHNIIMYCSLF